MAKKTKTLKRFVAIKVLSDRYRISQVKIWALARGGWPAGLGQQKYIEQKYDKTFGALFAEEDLVEWIETHPAEYDALLQFYHDRNTIANY